MAKKEKGQKRKKNSSDDGIIPPEKVDVFLLSIKIEACKISIQKAKKEYLKSKEELRELRAQFQKLISNGLVEVKRTLGKIEQFALNELEMTAEEVHRGQETEASMASYVKSYEDIIQTHQNRIMYLEQQIVQRGNDLIEFIEFGKVPDDQLQEEIASWEEKYNNLNEAHHEKLSKMAKRHEISLKNTEIRCERFINAAEDIACERETEKMSDSAIAEERRNRLLKCQIEHAKADQIRLMGEVSELEKKHMDLVQCDLQVDWDLRYTNFNDDEPFSENESEDFNCHRIDLTEKYKMLAANGQKENIAKEIVILELEKRRKNNPYGVFGEAILLNDRKISGPAKYHGAEF